MAEVYVSTDVEADGPIPGPNSMLSFASAAYLGPGRVVLQHAGGSSSTVRRSGLLSNRSETRGTRG